MIPALGLLLGVIIGLALQPTVPLWLQPYLPIAVIAALDAVFGGVHRPVAAFLHGLFAVALDGDFHQIADDRVHIAAHIAHLGELGRLDLDEGRVGEPRQTAGDLGLAYAGRADHQDVLGGDLALQRLRHLGAPPAVAQRHGHGLLGLALADDVLVEFGDDLRRRHLGHLGTLGATRFPARREISPLRRLCGLMASAPRWCGIGWCRCTDRRRW